MSDRLKALREKRAKIITDMRVITDLADTEKRDLSDEEVAKHGQLFDETEKLRKQITVEERQAEVDRERAGSEAEEEERRSKGEKDKDTPEARQLASFRTFLKGGIRALSEEERRSLSAGSDPEGGYLMAPAQVVDDLIKGLDNAVFIRGKATKHRVLAAQSLGVPTLDNDPDDFEWTTEFGTGSEDTATRFGRREFKPNPMAKRVKISKTLLRATARVETIVMDRLRYKLAITQEKNYLLGDGAKKPLGVFVASNDGIPAGRDVSTGNTSTAITFDGLIEAKYALKAGYWPTADWMFHRDAVKQLSKIKDLEGQYVWRESVREGEPDRLLGRPMVISEYVPNTITTGLYVGIFGDFSNYWIADALDLQIQRLLELYAEQNQDGFIMRYEGDGAPVLAEAFARVKLA